ncbi:MAG: hypothetical protein V3V47_00510, partial [Desulfobacteria bacterium]
EISMEPRPKPIHRLGNKNICCPFYGNCLDHAAKRHWQSWDCSECPHKQRQQAIKADQITDGFGPYCELPPGIYRHFREKFGAA